MLIADFDTVDVLLCETRRAHCKYTRIASLRERRLQSRVTKFPRTPRRLEPLYIRDPFDFITCCTYRRRRILANATFHNAFIRLAERAENEFRIAVGRYVILPDHLHFFVSLGEDKSLAQWMGTLKRVVGSAIKPIDSADPVWQRGFFDHVMRSADSYFTKVGLRTGQPCACRPCQKCRGMAVLRRDCSSCLQLIVDVSLCETRRADCK
jgi:putative transposase